MFLFAFYCGNCSAQGRPFYRPGPYKISQIIPAGPAWPASVQEYSNFNAGNSQRNMKIETTRRPNFGFREQARKTAMHFEKQNPFQNHQDMFSAEDYDY